MWLRSCGAIARANLEKDDPQAAPTISYESFVQDLDHGDSFTTTLVDILVKVSGDAFIYISNSLRSTYRSLRNAKHVRLRLTVTWSPSVL
jgi:hypothetical protein